MGVLDQLRKQASTTPSTNGHHPAPAPAGTPYVPNPDLKDEELLAAPPFPLDIFPERITRVVRDCYDYLGYPMDFTAAGILAATAIAIGRTTKVAYTWDETSCIYMALVAMPGTNKSHPLKFALDPIIQANKKAIKDYNYAQKQLAEAGQVTDNLQDKQCLFSDFTIEALVKAIQKNPRGIGVYIDELRAWFQNFNRYNSGSEQEFWLQNWSNMSMAVTRMTKKAFLEWPSISVIGTIQPSLLDEIGKGGRAQNGFVERMLFVYPDNVPVQMLRKRHMRSDTRQIIARNYTPILQILLDKQLASQLEGEEMPHEVGFTPEADDFITDFINELKVKMDALDNEYLRNVYSKLQSYSLRFCLLINRIDYACACQDNTDFPPSDQYTVTIDQAVRAGVLTDYFIAHAMKANNAVNSATPISKLPRDERKFYRALPFGNAFSTDVAETLAVEHKISRAKMFRMLRESDPSKRLFEKIRHGEYERIYV